MERIDQNQFFAAPEQALERARANGETLEITSGGKTVARLVPEPDVPKRAPLLPGNSKHVMRLTVPGDTLEDLWTPEDIASWYPRDDKFD